MENENPSVTPQETEQSAPNITDGLGAVLSNPELMAKLPQVMAMLRPMMEQQTAAPPPQKKAETDRSALLLALKPFLSEDRRNAVDAMLRLSALGDVLRRI